MMLATIKKFGLQHCDMPTMLWNVAVMLRALTLNIDIRNTKPIPIIVYIICLVISTAYFYVYLVSCIWFVFVRCRETGDLLAGLIVLSLGISSEIGTIKLICMFLNIGKIKHIVVDTLAFDATVIPGTRFNRNLMITMRDVKKRAMVFWIVIIGNGVVYVLKPILLPGRHFMEDKFVLYGLEPMYETPNYQIAFALTTCGVIFTCYLPANITALLIVVTGYIEAQILALTEEVKHLWQDAEEYYNKIQPNTDHGRETESEKKAKIMNEYVKEHIKDIIRGHGINIRLLHQVEDVYRGAIGLEFFLLGMGLISELLGGLENTYIEMPFAMMQVGMDCFTGQRVMDASMKFERAVYECQWEKYDRSNMKTVLMILQNSQKTMKLSAGGIIMLNFSCLMQVNKTIYSAYTTLRTTMHKK